MLRLERFQRGLVAKDSGLAVVAGRRGKMVCALWGRSWSPRPPRSQFSTGGITYRNP